MLEIRKWKIILILPIRRLTYLLFENEEGERMTLKIQIQWFNRATVPPFFTTLWLPPPFNPF